MTRIEGFGELKIEKVTIRAILVDSEGEFLRQVSGSFEKVTTLLSQCVCIGSTVRMWLTLDQPLPASLFVVSRKLIRKGLFHGGYFCGGDSSQPIIFKFDEIVYLEEHCAAVKFAAYEMCFAGATQLPWQLFAIGTRLKDMNYFVYDPQRIQLIFFEKGVIQPSNEYLMSLAQRMNMAISECQVAIQTIPHARWN